MRDDRWRRVRPLRSPSHLTHVAAVPGGGDTDDVGLPFARGWGIVTLKPAELENSVAATARSPQQPPAHPSLRERLHRAIPGGAHTYAKGDDQYPANAPAAIVRGKGCRVWDVNGREYVEYGSGLRSVTLGHAYPSVVRAAAAALENGANFLRPSPLEVECAEQLLGLVEGADMVKFTKDGSTATTGASSSLGHIRVAISSRSATATSSRTTTGS